MLTAWMFGVEAVVAKLSHIHKSLLAIWELHAAQGYIGFDYLESHLPTKSTRPTKQTSQTGPIKLGLLPVAR
ncbi:hypothetical protein NITMOv2_2877 [Nitrospira moscoviensis]|uniref:Uncharacterized protein n=1 Tax=Nitrospira moscoviensis TaxID=42253 RepID=A0A0K2GEA3_NITMO|nr:hypothetical protein NITMOv2_2877 [Nitrospira moscoviensis]